MAYTGHKDTKMQDGKTLVAWLRPTIQDECRHFGVPEPTEEQVAIVISALRMHTVIMQAATYDNSELGQPDEITKYWPIESSIGRYFRDAARETLDAISLCDACNCMTHTRSGKCGKCEATK